jgi:hypothetical protein
VLCWNETSLAMEETDSCRGRPWELKESVRCVFCRGVACKRCGENAYLNAISPAIEKFHCNWITDEILAMQRPADELFASIDLLGQFKALQITAVLNLTEPGEHPFCGYGNKSSGFPYSPERLMAVGSESPVTFSLFFCLFFFSQTFQLRLARHDSAVHLFDTKYCSCGNGRAA